MEVADRNREIDSEEQGSCAIKKMMQRLSAFIGELLLPNKLEVRDRITIIADLTAEMGIPEKTR